MADRLFMKNVPVTLVQVGQETRKANICVAIEIEYASSPVTRKVVVVRLTDERDLLFLYHMRMTEDEYRRFKDEKHLVFGFEEFPQFLMDYLDCCIEQDNADDKELFAQLTFHGGDRAEFHVMQFIKLPVSDKMPKTLSKNVKRDSILPLDLLRGTDSDIKCYLAVCLRDYQEENANLVKNLTDAEHDLSDARAALAARCQELTNITTDWTAKLNEVSAKHSEELNGERQKLLQLQGNMQQRYDRERKEMEQAHVKIVKEFESRMHELENTNRELADTKYKNELTIRDLTAKITTIEGENERVRADLQTIRSEFSNLGSDRSEQERELTHVRLKIAVLEQDMKVKDEQLRRVADELSFERDAKRKMEEEVERKRRHLREQAAIIKDKANDINKANEIIAKLQNDNIAYHSELKLRRMTIVEQEKEMNDKAQQFEQMKRDLETSLQTIKQKEQEVHEAKDKLEECFSKLRESRDKIIENENVIQYLSRNVTEMQLSQQRPAGMFEMASRVPPASTGQTSINRTSSSILTQPSFSNPTSQTSRLSTTPSIGQTPPTNNRPSSQQFHGVSSEIPVPVNKSTPIGGGNSISGGGQGNLAGKRLSTESIRPRDGGIDPKYFEADAQPPRPSASNGGGSSLRFPQNSVRRSAEFSSAPPFNSGRPPLPPSQPERTLQAPLASSYFPAKA